MLDFRQLCQDVLDPGLAKVTRISLFNRGFRSTAVLTA